MSLIRKGTAEWFGTGLEGSGELSSPSGVLNKTPYNVSHRFENENGVAGTNPEELIASAHAGCFCMALSFQIVAAGYTPTRLATEAVIHMKQEGYDWSFEGIDLNLQAQVEGITEEKLVELATIAKESCPVSMALFAVPIKLNTKLI
jgi:osmotically inducible protein OsmC